MARAQPNDNLQFRLRTLAAAAELLDSKLPAFTCHETFTSQLLQGRKVKRQVTGSGELRVQPNDEGKLDEDFQTAEIDGHPAQGFPRAPIFVEGGFQNAIQLFRPSDQRCFIFRSQNDRIEFQSRPDAPEDPCGRRTGVRGYAVFDSSGNLDHIESHTEEEAATRRHIVPYAALDLAQVQLGGTTFLLSTHVLAELYAGKTTRRWEATYFGCRLYQVTVKIGPATAPSEDSPK
jgi:hypothetical protein